MPDTSNHLSLKHADQPRPPRYGSQMVLFYLMDSFVFDVYGSDSRDIRIVMERNEAGDQDWEGGWVGLDDTVRVLC